ncbi:hypothetical protein MK079_00760, partial [Candidatus Gracilibacteria bacterium]|nr:hypothetical protein [Candidatus Gracilibacteria bacterium]
FEVSDANGNTVSQLLDFYIDIPEFIISTGSIDIGVIDHLSESFSDTVTVTVRTLGAGFDVTMNTTTLPSYSSESLSDWDGSDGFGYQASPFSGTITTIASNQNIASQASGINTNGQKNTYTYDIQLGALIEQTQSAGNYIGSIDFGIELDY